MSKRKKHAHHEEEGGEAWLLPYSDLMTLLLAVFIVLFASSQIDQEKAQQISNEFSESMMSKSYTASKMEGQDSASKESSGSAKSEKEQMEKLKAELDAKLKSKNMTASVKTNIDDRGLIISLSNAIVFESGSAEIKKENEDTLLEIARMVSITDHYVRIEGHTDNVPMSSDLYPSNWDLSTARAANVVRLFVNKANALPENLIAVGYGEYRPVADNSTEKGRAQNRRIDIIVMSEKYSGMEE